MSRKTAFCVKAVISVVQGLVGFLLTLCVVCFLLVAGCGYVTWDTPLGLISPGSVYGLFWISFALLIGWVLLDRVKGLLCPPVPKQATGRATDLEVATHEKAVVIGALAGMGIVLWLRCLYWAYCSVLFQHQQIDSPPFWQINMTYLPTVVASAFLWIQLRSGCGVLPALAGASFYLIGPLAFDVTAAVAWSFLGVSVFIVLLSLVPQIGSPFSLKWIIPVVVLPLFVILPFISHRYGPGWEMHLLPHYVLLGLSNVFVGFGVIAILSRKLGDGRLVPYVALGILGLLAGPVVNEFGAAARALVLPFAASLYAVGTRFIIDIPWIRRRPFALNIALLLAAGAILHLLKIGLDGHPFEVW